MSQQILAWGEGTLKYGESTGSETSAYTDFPTIVEKSATLTTTPGATLEARKQGGKMIAKRSSADTHVYVVEVYNAAGTVLPNIVKNKNYSISFTPENSAAPGFKMPYCSVTFEDRWDEDKGATVAYTFTELEPTSGEGFEWTLAVVTVNPTSLSFVAGGESKTATVVTPGSASVSSSESWLTASISGATITATAASNSGSARTATITVTQGSNTTTISISQAAA
jgi:hypothetical protein